MDLNGPTVAFVVAGVLGVIAAFQRVGDKEAGRFVKTGTPYDVEGDEMTELGFDHIYQQVGRTYGVSPRLLKAVARVESSERPNAVNPSDPSYGLMQVLCRGDGDGGCANALNVQGWPPVSKQELFDPRFNVQIGAQILQWNLDTYGFPKGVAVYNKWSARMESSPFSNQGYVDKVLDAFESLGGGDPRDGSASL